MDELVCGEIRFYTEYMEGIMIQRTGNWIIDLIVDDDGHLTIGVNHADGTKVIPLNVDIATYGEWVERFSTERIEEDYIANEEPVEQGKCPNCGKTGNFRTDCPDCPSFGFADMNSLPK